MTDDKPEKRRLSGIRFPYRDLETSIALAKVIHDAKTTIGLPASGIALALNHTTGSGHFLNRIASARMFGLIDEKDGRYTLARLGRTILTTDGRPQRDAMVRAFLNVPLYRRLFDEFEGKHLPLRPHGLQQKFIELGVPEKVADRARHGFEHSARFAGFFCAGEDQLVRPPFDFQPLPPPDPTRAEDAPPRAATPARRETPPSEHHFVQGLLDSLPPMGTTWPLAERVEWLKLAVHSFNLIYKSDGDIEVKGTPKPAPRPQQAAPATPRLVRDDDTA